LIERGVEAGTHPEAYCQLTELHPIGLLGKPEEIAEATVWLCSDASTFETGYALAADGHVAQ
jgi:NAD(P)-dependent dehydrogenase (short-subunit alcohol dehydrogenase family)